MKNIALIGLMGCGKTTIGRFLSSELNMNFVDIDEKIAAKENMSISSIFAEKKEKYFRALETETLKDFTSVKNTVISTGGGAMEKEENIAILKNTCIIFYLKASPEILFERIKNDNTRPLLQNINPLKILQELLEKRRFNYQKADIIIDTENRSVEEIVNEIIKHVKS